MPIPELPPDTGHEGAATHVVEADRRLSESLLWSLQRRYYDRQGIDAWRTATVPHYVTSNPALAHAYARVFLAFLGDCRAGSPSFAADEPVVFLELGAGSGRFAYHFLTAFTELHRRSRVAGVRFRYVMTDFTEANLAFLRSHDKLRPFVEQGCLDFALFDVERDVSLRLLESGAVLGPGGLANPLGVIANYVFDTTSHDAFWFGGGQIHESLVSLSSSEPVVDHEDPGLLGKLAVTYARRPAPSDYYGDPELDRVLHLYASRLDGVAVLFPRVAIQCLRRLAALSGGGRLLLLSGDRGQVSIDELGPSSESEATIHGPFLSCPVNYHAIAEYVRGRGGAVLTPAHRHEHLRIVGFLLGEDAGRYVDVLLAYDQAVSQAGPMDFFALRQGIQGSYEQLAPEHLLSMIRLSRYDSRIAFDCLPALWRRLGEANADVRRDLAVALRRSWDCHYPIGEERDMAFELGRMLYALGAFDDALALFEASARLHGTDARTSWNAGLCHYRARRFDEAARLFEEAARLDPDFSPEGALQSKGALEDAAPWPPFPVGSVPLALLSRDAVTD